MVYIIIVAIIAIFIVIIILCSEPEKVLKLLIKFPLYSISIKQCITPTHTDFGNWKTAILSDFTVVLYF